MDYILDIIKYYGPIIDCVLALIVIILFFMLIAVMSSLGKLKRKYRSFMRGVENKNLEETILQYLDKVENASRTCEDVKGLLSAIERKVDTCVQKISIIRYKAFEDVGSDLSFSIALLDNKNSGVIITGIYGRNDSTTYAKPIDKGLSRYDLSDEEQEALNEAMHK
ncbi:DUF4446 family protein [Clostridium oryzae]|uniref:DUF4446 domain-containing protein n=1 Tax=Clostridium oryzae TaxID=1450648 RepID=A0A1V4IF94_9CLOT|nr:DUF4446 family protein [Clostridium oryzae]OPJ58678.1 hypothetical protein CLORY_35120 [Clostridium oryzae]